MISSQLRTLRIEQLRCYADDEVDEQEDTPAVPRLTPLEVVQRVTQWWREAPGWLADAASTHADEIAELKEQHRRHHNYEDADEYEEGATLR